MIVGFLSALAEFIIIQGMCSIFEHVLRYNLVWGSLHSINLDFNYDYFMRLFEFLVDECIHCMLATSQYQPRLSSICIIMLLQANQPIRLQYSHQIRY